MENSSDRAPNLTHRSLTNSGWIVGGTRSGKTAQLVDRFCAWADRREEAEGVPGVLVLAAIGDNRMDLTDRLTEATQARYPFRATTPLGWFEDEVRLFWSLLIQRLDLVAQFPVRLRPENEQELATRLWQPTIDQMLSSDVAHSPKLVRRLLDVVQLAALSGTPWEEVPRRLQQGLETSNNLLPLPAEVVGELLGQWRRWCLDRGLLTYSLIAELYGQQLLRDAVYQEKLIDRFGAVFADDVDEYPAIVRPLFELFLAAGLPTVLTFNPNGAVRLGLGADPSYLGELADRLPVVELPEAEAGTLWESIGESVVELAIAPPFLPPTLPESMQALQTGTRAQLLRQTAEVIIRQVKSGQIEPREIAMIGPGLEPITRYALTKILAAQGIRVENLNEQRPLSSVPIVRVLLTLLTLVYPGLGRLVRRDAIAEMLVILSQAIGSEGGSAGFAIDPVRAGLLADHCFAPHPESPQLLSIEAFARWDRLGYEATRVYGAIIQWIEAQKVQLEQRLIGTPVVLIDRAIQRFFGGGTHLPSDQIASLRELMETAQHYWLVDARLQASGGDPQAIGAASTVERFVQLLRSGTVTANPFPVRPIGPSGNAVTLATVFQYRSSRRSHRWQVWLDVGSPRWLSGVDSLFAAPLFLQGWDGTLWTAEDEQRANEERLQRILRDLLGRSTERVILGHSDLATNGREQTGPLLSVVYAASSIEAESIISSR